MVVATRSVQRTGVPSPRSPQRPSAGSTQRAPAWFRPDIEGLRAVAVLLVVLYHAGVPGIPGGFVGVDVFFVISGFLITQLLLRELARSGEISIPGFYARRFVRLLPAASVVLVATLVAAWVWMPPVRFRGIAVDALFTVGYAMNYRLAVEGTDYLASAQTPSPLQHFWSLAVEEQFYVVWPLLIGVIGLIWGRTRGRRRRRHSAQHRRTVVPHRLVAILGAVIVVSFALSIWQTAASAPWAYFGAHTRAWELAVGALVAVLAPRLPDVPVLYVVVGLVGLGCVVVAAVRFDAGTPFPGSAAALPVLGTAAVIATGHLRPLPVLRLPGLEHIGRVSYSWYLWHWPVLIIGPHALGVEPALGWNLALAAFALLLAALTLVAVENPVRHRGVFKVSSWRGLGLGVGLSAYTAVVGVVAMTVPLRQLPVGENAVEVNVAGSDGEVAGSDASRALGELIAASAATTTVPANLTPSLVDAPRDSPPIYPDTCHRSIADVGIKTPCLYGDPAGTATIVLYGDSHAGHWFDALDAIAKQRKLRLAVVTKSSCTAASVRVYEPTLKREYVECRQFQEAATEYIATLDPVLVVMSSSGAGGRVASVADSGQDQAWANGWAAAVRTAAATGARVVVIEDTPWPKGDVPECLSANAAAIGACASSPEQAIRVPTRRRMVAAAVATAGATVIDPTPWLCTPKVCPPVVGNLLVYRDGSHLTTAYSAALAPVLAEKLP
ncbi:SGNH hydrolase domain-containing protein [Virgisporangium ochraceum]|uniref:Acyltransferase n=1 Tax=Virgisporangium ochraceum TaxID=65505 RepID=A0A8J3ZTB4_9ACTN|nr:acyltransferase family protein [Virgisporangium ochraceum]GIJ67673.1 acyltransferase [Virgisporangium ochraceum]